ncbi:hypothetical protein CMUS01_04661 [Colletotrichum musicola]|uniref:Uncharacterized protein n=1 Tax=Colletotrichum musicola TaxID=2175873 RepID=A0A8H6KWB3_9PEZI|nr:hypothetical protein CMUS01_04661 [Colletotrichum musicola]
MPDSVPSGQDLVPKRVWATIGGTILSPQPTWDRLISMTAGRNRIGRAAEAEKKEFKEASREAKNELKAAKKAYKDKYGGGLAAWKKTEEEQRMQ